jgi:drug/metabolite transporter (DMT)-like permease
MRPADSAQLLLLAGIWGSSFLFIKVGLEDFDPIHIVAGRIVLGALFLLAIVYASGRSLPRELKLWRSLVLMAVVSNIIPFALITWGQQEISSSLAAILNSTTPLFTAALAAAFVPGESLDWVRGAGIGLGFVGVVVVIGPEASGSLLGELAVVAASLSYGIGFVYARRKLTNRTGGPLVLSAGQLLIGSILIAPVAVASLVANPPTPSGTAVAAVIALGLAGTGLAYVLYYRLVGSVGATTSSFVTFLIPIFGVTLGAIVLNERLGWNAIAGTLLVIGGIAIAEMKRSSKPRPSPTPARRPGF